MRLKEVTLTNFRSYKGVHTFKPRLGASFILGSNSDNGYSSNGGGKTSLLSAIAWALYGELATGASKDSLIFYGGSEVAVEIKFEGLIVRRSKKRSKSEILEFFSDEYGTWINEDLALTQDKLDSYLGVSKDLFFNAFWLDNASKTVQFLFKRPSDRLQVLQDLLGEGFFSQAKKAATSRRLEAEREGGRISDKIHFITSQREARKLRISSMEVECHKYEKQLERNEKEFDKKISKVVSELEKARHDYEVIKQRHLDFVDTRPYDLEGLVRNCAVLEVQIQQQEEKCTKAYAGVVDEVCPTCLRAIESRDREKLEEDKKASLREVTRLRALLDTETKKRNQAKKDKKTADEMAVEVSALRAQINALGAHVATLRESTDEVARQALESLKKSLEDDRRKYKEEGNILVQLEKERDKLNSLIPKIKFWEDGFGSKGIQNLLLDDVRALLNQFTRNYLAHFSGEVLKVSYPKSDKGFEITVSYRDKDTPVSSLSRGEVGRANMAVLLALRKMLLYMRKSKVDFIVLDDAISDLDESGTQSIVDLADVLSKEVGHVFVTLPQPVPSIRQDLVVRVSKKDGVSCVS